MAFITLGLGEKDATFEWLERALAEHDVHGMFLTVDSKWDPLREDPRFKSILKRCDFMRTAGLRRTFSAGRALGVRPGSDRGQTGVRPGQTGVRPGSDRQTRVRPRGGHLRAGAVAQR